jgi:putative PIN family toxin of toxin-antitoxin system
VTRVVLDTNVLVSGLGWSGPPAAIVDAVTAGELTLLSSPALIAELRRVLRYPKLAKMFADPNAIADLVAGASVQVHTFTQLQVVDDDSDNRVLEERSRVAPTTSSQETTTCSRSDRSTGSRS